MATSPEFVEFVLEQIDDDCEASARKMFGEYGLYSGDKFIGLICDDRLFFKQTEGGRAWMPEITEGEPYPGAKPALLIEDGLEDPGWLSEMVRITTRELPAPKKKKKKKKKA